MIGFSFPWLMRLNRLLAEMCGPQTRKILLRVNQETGPQIVLFRRGFARFDRHNTADGLTIRQIRIHAFGLKREQIWAAHARYNAFHVPE
jgi:hypothetical protein